MNLKGVVPVWIANAIALILTISHVEAVLGVAASALTIIYTIIKIYKELKNGKIKRTKREN